MSDKATDKDERVRRLILRWANENPRDLPWKGTKDPYVIWVSEIILQQTRVRQGIPYFHRFLDAFPDIETLAAADEDRLLKVWEGLGYYRRARHMHETAREIVEIKDGRFPDTHEDILNLKGVGSYTAAAIASFAYDLPHAVLDGNVARVITRIYGVFNDIQSQKGKRRLMALADAILDRSDPGRFNQAMMDFGARQCTPGKPACDDCRLKTYCYAYQHDCVRDLPVKKKKKPKRDRYLYYLVIRDRHGRYWLKKRRSGDIWAGLHEFYLCESGQYVEWSELLKGLSFSPKVEVTSDRYRQILSHQRIFAFFAEVLVEDLSRVDMSPDTVVESRKKLQNLAFPRIIDCYLKDNNVNLNLTF